MGVWCNKYMEGLVLSAHIEELAGKHRTLEQKIEREMSRPHSDTLKIAEMKRAKLKIKDKITRLEKTSHQ